MNSKVIEEEIVYPQQNDTENSQNKNLAMNNDFIGVSQISEENKNEIPLKTNSKEEIAQNYKSAAELMINFNSPNKAKSLLKKALVNAVKTTNEDLIAEVNTLLASVEG